MAVTYVDEDPPVDFNLRRATAEVRPAARCTLILRSQPTWALTMLGLSALCLVLYYSYRASLPPEYRRGLAAVPPLDRLVPFAGWFEPGPLVGDDPARERRDRQGYALAGCLTMTACYAWVAKPTAIAVLSACRFPTPEWDLFLNFALAAMALFTLIHLVLATVVSGRQWRREGGIKGLGPRGLRLVLAALLILSVLIVWRGLGLRWTRQDLDDEYFAFLRTVDIASGISTLLPAGFTSLALLAWAACQINRLNISGRFHIPGRYLKGYVLEGLARDEGHVRHALRGPLDFLKRTPAAMILLVGVDFVLAKIVSLHIPTVEGRVFDIGLLCAFSLGCLLITVEIVRFHVLTRRLLALFRGLSKVLNAHEFQKMSDTDAKFFARALSNPEASRACLELIEPKRAALTAAAIEIPPRGVSWGGQPEPIAGLLRSLPAAPAGLDKASSAEKEYVAMVLVLYASQFTLHLRKIADFLTLGPLLLLMATIYPLQPERLIDVFLWIGTAVAFASVAYSYVQFERSEFVSWVRNTEPFKIDLKWETLAKAGVALLPLLGVLLAQFPDVSDMLYNYLGPLLRSLR